MATTSQTHLQIFCSMGILTTDYEDEGLNVCALDRTTKVFGYEYGLDFGTGGIPSVLSVERAVQSVGFYSLGCSDSIQSKFPSHLC